MKIAPLCRRVVATRTHCARIGTLLRWLKYFTVCITYQSPLVFFSGRDFRDTRERVKINLKSAIKIGNTARLSCKLTLIVSDTHSLKSGRQVAVRCRNITRRLSSSVKMAAPLATCTKEEQRYVISVLSDE